MRKVLMLMIVPLVMFGHNALWGTRGTFNIYSGRCEDPGLFLLNLNTWFYMGPDSIPEVDTVTMDTISYRRVDAMRLSPIVSVSFTPWKYLEFGGFVMGTYYTYDTYTSSTQDLYRYIGFVAKGGIPFGTPDEGFYFVPGVKGLAVMDVVSTNNQRFGGTGILSTGYRFIELHINAGYEYLTANSSAEIISGAGIEISPFNFLSLCVGFVDTTDQNNLSNISSHKMAVIPGIRFGFRDGFYLFANVGASIGIQNLPQWNAVGGISLGYDFIRPRKFIVKGRVVDAKTKEPVSDAKVYMEEHPEIATFTNGDGNFELELPGPGTIVVEHPNYNVATATVEEGEVYQIGVEPTKPGVIELESRESRITGVVSDAVTEEPLSAVIRFHALYSDTVVPSVVSDPLSGYYERNLPAGSYRVVAHASGYLEVSKTVHIRSGETVNIDFKLKKIKKEKPKKPVFKNIYFGRGSIIPLPRSMEALQDALRILKQNPSLKVVIEGHTDSVGKKRANYYLSLRRARWVRDYLVKHGISPERLRIKGYGETRPIGDNRTVSGRALNRRVEIKPL